jgi:hypothetical protein
MVPGRRCRSHPRGSSRRIRRAAYAAPVGRQCRPCSRGARSRQDHAARRRSRPPPVRRWVDVPWRGRQRRGPSAATGETTRALIAGRVGSPPRVKAPEHHRRPTATLELLAPLEVGRRTPEMRRGAIAPRRARPLARSASRRRPARRRHRRRFPDRPARRRTGIERSFPDGRASTAASGDGEPRPTERLRWTCTDRWRWAVRVRCSPPTCSRRRSRSSSAGAPLALGPGSSGSACYRDARSAIAAARVAARRGPHHADESTGCRRLDLRGGGGAGRGHRAVRRRTLRLDVRSGRGGGGGGVSTPRPTARERAGSGYAGATVTHCRRCAGSGRRRGRARFAYAQAVSPGRSDRPSRITGGGGPSRPCVGAPAAVRIWSVRGSCPTPPAAARLTTEKVPGGRRDGWNPTAAASGRSRSHDVIVYDPSPGRRVLNPTAATIWER